MRRRKDGMSANISLSVHCDDGLESVGPELFLGLS